MAASPLFSPPLGDAAAREGLRLAEREAGPGCARPRGGLKGGRWRRGLGGGRRGAARPERGEGPAGRAAFNQFPPFSPHFCHGRGGRRAGWGSPRPRRCGQGGWGARGGPRRWGRALLTGSRWQWGGGWGGGGFDPQRPRAPTAPPVPGRERGPTGTGVPRSCPGQPRGRAQSPAAAGPQRGHPVWCWGCRCGVCCGRQVAWAATGGLPLCECAVKARKPYQGAAFGVAALHIIRVFNCCSRRKALEEKVQADTRPV